MYLVRLMQLIIFLTMVFSTHAKAITIENKLSDPALEIRAAEIFTGLRCMVCAGESIADSRAELAKELRTLVRDKVQQGYSNQQVLDYAANIYGDVILMKPKLQQENYLLWFGPGLMILLGLLFVSYKAKQT